MNTRAVVLLAAAVSCLAAGFARGKADTVGYKIVVNAANPESTITREQLANLFLKNTRQWSDGTPALPVDQSVLSRTRAAFSKDVFGQPVVAIQSYWQQQVAAGRDKPPVVKASDREVLAYVDGNAGAVGYVAGGAALSGKTKALRVTE